VSSLHDLTNDWLRMSEGLTELENDDDARAILDEMLSDLETALDQKAERVALVIDELIRKGEAINDIAKTYQARAQRCAKRADWLKQYLLRSMQTVGKEKIEGERASVSIRLGTKKVEVDEGVDIDLIPDDLVKVERSLSLSAIKESLEAGEQLAWARIVRRPYLKVTL
jgi:hypothetical protein